MSSERVIRWGPVHSSTERGRTGRPEIKRTTQSGPPPSAFRDSASVVAIADSHSLRKRSQPSLSHTRTQSLPSAMAAASISDNDLPRQLGRTNEVKPEKSLFPSAKRLQKRRDTSVSRQATASETEPLVPPPPVNVATKRRSVDAFTPPKPKVRFASASLSRADGTRVQKDLRLAESIQSRSDTEDLGTMKLMLSYAQEEARIASDAALARRLQAEQERKAQASPSTTRPPASRASSSTSRATPPQSLYQVPVQPSSPAAGQTPPISQENLEKFLKALFKSQDYRALSRPVPTAKCGICSERFVIVQNLSLELRHSRAQISRDAVGSLHRPLPNLLGTTLSCPNKHAYCGDCFIKYVQSRFDIAKLPKPTFPIPCPGCLERPYAVTDVEADRILPYPMLQEWKRRRYEDANFVMFCPNRRCSAPILTGGTGACQNCRTPVCTNCKSHKHSGMSCAAYQALPPDKRTPEDRKLLALAKQQNWRNCPQCNRLIELVSGCRHMSCPCGAEFCFKCGSMWNHGCTGSPPCELWAEDELVERPPPPVPTATMRGRARAPVPAPAPVAVATAPPARGRAQVRPPPVAFREPVARTAHAPAPRAKREGSLSRLFRLSLIG